MKNYLGPEFATNIYLKDIMSTSASSTIIGNLKHLSGRLPQTLPRYPHHLASRHPVQGMNLMILVTHIRPLTTHNKGSSETIASVLQKRGMIAGVLNSPVCIPKILRQSLGVLVYLHPIPCLLHRSVGGPMNCKCTPSLKKRRCVRRLPILQRRLGIPAFLHSTPSLP
jgi:hypothetical protein